MSTVYEVANLAGVSTATVSRVVHGSNLVHPDTRERVLAVIEELGYVPDGSAQGLSRRRKDIIGLAGLERGITEVGIEKTGALFMDELVHAVEAVLRGTECSLLLTFGRAGEQFQRPGPGAVRQGGRPADRRGGAAARAAPGAGPAHPGGGHRRPPGRNRTGRGRGGQRGRHGRRWPVT